MRKLLFLLFIPVLFVSCVDSGPSNDDVVKQPSRDGSVEAVLSVKHEADFDVLTVTDTVWVANHIQKVIITKDTLQTLGTTTAEGDEDDNGNIPQVTVPKNYEIYITVK